MVKSDFYNVVDLGASKIRFSTFNKTLEGNFLDVINLPIEKEDSQVSNEFNNIIKKAEKKISSHIKNIILTLDTNDLICIDISIFKNYDNSIYLSKIYDSILLELNNLIISNYSNYNIIHTILNQINVDENIFYALPKEKIKIKSIKAEFKIICFPKEIISNYKKKFKKINLNIDRIFCTSYLKSSSYARKLNKKNVFFLDIGFKKTSLITFENFRFKMLQIFPIGGFHITNDISKVFKISMEEAENIKRSFNKSETEFSYEKSINDNSFSAKNIIKNNISIDILKKVILYRVQEIIDLTFKKSNINNINININEADLFLIGDGSLLLNNNSFHLKDKFKSINFYSEKDIDICNSALVYYLNNYEIPRITNKKSGFFERFFNLFNN